MGGMQMAAIAVGADSAGASLKEHLARYLQDHGYEVKDFGNADFADYPDVAAAVDERHRAARTTTG
jgi:ribose 5-phosphate isomerase RpiB